MKMPIEIGNEDHEKTEASFYACFGATRFFFQIPENIPKERNALNSTDKSPCQKLATKIKAFQSAFEVKI